MTSVPTLGLLLMIIPPRCASTNDFTKESPMPEPTLFCPNPSTRWKRSKILGKASFSSPTPSSCTFTMSCLPAKVYVVFSKAFLYSGESSFKFPTDTDILIELPALEYLMALERILESILLKYFSSNHNFTSCSGSVNCSLIVTCFAHSLNSL